VGIFDKIVGTIGSALGLVDKLHTSDEERLKLKAALLDIQSGIISEVIDAENKALQAQAQVLQAEAQSTSKLTAMWRPITMLTFLALIVAASFGLVDTASLGAVPDRMWSMLTLGISGYIGGRSMEKIVPSVMTSLKSVDRT
jgi:hypothetical protein